MTRTMGPKRMYELGYRAVQLWFTPQEVATIAAAAKANDKRVCIFVRDAVMRACGEDNFQRRRCRK